MILALVALLIRGEMWILRAFLLHVLHAVSHGARAELRICVIPRSLVLTSALPNSGELYRIGAAQSHAQSSAFRTALLVVPMTPTTGSHVRSLGRYVLRRNRRHASR